MGCETRYFVIGWPQVVQRRDSISATLRNRAKSGLNDATQDVLGVRGLPIAPAE